MMRVFDTEWRRRLCWCSAPCLGGEGSGEMLHNVEDSRLLAIELARMRDTHQRKVVPKATLFYLPHIEACTQTLAAPAPTEIFQARISLRIRKTLSLKSPLINLAHSGGLFWSCNYTCLDIHHPPKRRNAESADSYISRTSIIKIYAWKKCLLIFHARYCGSQEVNTHGDVLEDTPGLKIGYKLWEPNGWQNGFSVVGGPLSVLGYYVGSMYWDRAKVSVRWIRENQKFKLGVRSRVCSACIRIWSGSSISSGRTARGREDPKVIG